MAFNGLYSGTTIRPPKETGDNEQRWVTTSVPNDAKFGTTIRDVHLDEVLANIRRMIRNKLLIGLKADGQTETSIRQLSYKENRIFHWLILGYVDGASASFPKTLDKLTDGPGDYNDRADAFVRITDKTNNRFDLHDVDDLVVPLSTTTLYTHSGALPTTGRRNYDLGRPIGDFGYLFFYLNGYPNTTKRSMSPVMVATRAFDKRWQQRTSRETLMILGDDTYRGIGLTIERGDDDRSVDATYSSVKGEYIRKITGVSGL